MHIMVTGGAGYIGSHTVEKLLRAGFEVVVYDNLSSGFVDAVPQGATLVVGDMLDARKLEETMRASNVGTIVHFASKLIVPESMIEPAIYYETNVIGMLQLLKAARNCGVDKIIFSSTAAVYGNGSGEEKINEGAETRPLNPYGRSKRVCEQILQDYSAAYGVESVCLRYFNVAGASLDISNGQRTANATHLIKVSAEAAVGKRKSLGIFGSDYATPDGTCVRDYIHVEDLADIHVLALKHLERHKKSLILNCGYGQGFSVLDVIRTFQKFSSEFQVHELPRRAGDAARLVADNSLVMKTLNWVPTRNNLEVICRSAFEWERSR